MALTCEKLINAFGQAYVDASFLVAESAVDIGVGVLGECRKEP